MNRTEHLAFTVLMALGIVGCRGASVDQLVRDAGTGDVSFPSESLMAFVPLGDWAGATPNTLATTIKNPYNGDESAIRAGGELFEAMNCADCHGYDLSGGMGPNLRDTYWRYGGSPAEIYKSIYEGRPQGMPAWGRLLPSSSIWKLAAFIQDAGGSFPSRMAERAKQGDLGDKDTSGARTLKGRQYEDF